MAKWTWRSVWSRSKGKTEGRRRGRHRRITPRHQHIRLVLPLTPAVNTGPRWRARPRDASAARPLASACHAGVWSSVSTTRPRLDGKRRGARVTQRERGQGNARGVGEKRRGDSRRIKRRESDRGERWRRLARARGARTRWRHQWRAKGRRGTSRDKTLPRRTYISGRSTETGCMPIQALIWTKASVTTQRGRCGSMT